MSGRTIWLAKDADWWTREQVVDLGEEYGPAGPAVLDWLECAAKRQNDGGHVKAGMKSLARGVFSDVVTVRNVVQRSVTLKLLLDFQEDSGIFKCVISWWHADQERALTADRVARHRERLAAAVTVSNGASRSVTNTGQESTEQKDLTTPSATPTDVRTVFDAWVKSTGKTSKVVLDPKRVRLITNALRLYPLDDVLDAVDGWRFSAHHRGENDRATVFNGLHLLLRSSDEIEKFRDYKRNGATNANGNGHKPARVPNIYDEAVARKAAEGR